MSEAEATLGKAGASLAAGPDRESRLIWVADGWNWLSQLRWNAGDPWRAPAGEAAVEAVRVNEENTRGQSKHPGRQGLHEAEELLAEANSSTTAGR